MAFLKRVALLLLTLPSLCYALPRFSGYCQQGNTTVRTSSTSSANVVQGSFPRANVTAYITGGAVGVVSTSGTAVTWVSGTQFDANSDWNGIAITINSVSYVVGSVASVTSLTLTSSAGTQTSVAYSVANAPAPIFLDYAGGTPKSNPLTCDSTGYYFFYAANSTLDLKFSGTGITTPFTLAAVSGIDPIATTTGFITYNASIGTAAQQCTAAANANQTLQVAQPMAALSTQSMNCSIAFLQGGLIQPASRQAVTLSGTITAAPGQKIFDISLGTVTLGSNALNPVVYPEWWGAVGDGTTDDYAAIQAAINAVSYGTTTISTGLPKAAVEFACKPYAIQSPLTFFVQSGIMRGCGRGGAWNSLTGTLIVYTGSSTSAYALTVGGFYSVLQNLSVVIGNGTGWAAGIDYEGSQGKFDFVSVDCGGLSGNGITGGAENLGQSDQLEMTKVSASNCWNGSGIKTTEGNALSWHLTNGSIYNNLYGISTNTSTNFTVTGGEFDYNGINFFPGAGSTLNATGWRSEGSRRGAYNGGGSYSSPIAITSSSASAQSDNLATVTATCSTGSPYVVVLSGNTNIAPDTAFMSADFITIAGAGAAGATLHTELGNASTDNNHFALGYPCSTSVSGAAVALDNSATIANQAYFSFNGSGPYIIQGSQFGHSATYNTPIYISGGNVTIQNNAWDLNVTNPFFNGVTPSTATLLNNVTNCNVACAAISNQENQSISDIATANITTLNVSGVTTPTTIKTGTTSLTNVAGTTVLDGSGTYSYTFTGNYTNYGICIAQDYQASPVVITPSWTSSGGTYTVTFTAATGAAASGHAFGYHCIMTK